MKKSIFICLIFICYFPENLFSQKKWSNEIVTEIGSPTLIYNYPDKSLIFRLGYQSRFRVKKIDIGISIIPEFNQFKILDNQLLSILPNEMIIRSYGIRIGGFLGKNISNYFSIDGYIEYGEYTSNIITKIENMNRAPKVTAIRSYNFGVKLNYKWKNRCQLFIKVSYEIYKNSSKTIFQTAPNFGVFVFESLGLNQNFVNGVFPSFGMKYTIF